MTDAHAPAPDFPGWYLGAMDPTIHPVHLLQLDREGPWRCPDCGRRNDCWGIVPRNRLLFWDCDHLFRFP